MHEPRRTPVLLLAALLGLLLLPGVPAQAQQVGQITGQITNSMDQAPLSGVQVSVEGTGIGGLSNNAGRFLLQNVPPGTHTVTVITIGYASESAQVTVVAGQTTVQNFRLDQEAVTMDEIVVTGVPGGTRRRAIGNSVGTLEGSAVTNAAPMPDIQSVLRGRVPSVNMMGTGVVGAAPRMRVRGASTFSLAGNPLIYIDGVRANNAETTGYTYGNAAGIRSMLTSLDPEQIERIEVLKGPAAATLYGTEASRGVVNIITRRGQAGGLKLEMLLRQGVNYLANPTDKPGYENYWIHPQTREILSMNQMEHLESQGQSPFVNGPIQTYSATLTGGSPDTRYFFSGTYSKETGVVEWNWAKKLNIRTNIDSQLSEDLGASLSMGFTNSKDRIPTDGFSSVIEGVEFGSPRFLPENRCQVNPGFGCDLFNGYNNQAMPSRDHSLHNTQDLNRFTGSLTLNHEAFGWLSSRLTTGIDFTSQLDIAYREFQTNDTTIAVLGSVASRGFREERRQTYFLTTTDLSSTANFRLNEALTSATSVGFQYYTRSRSFLEAGGQQFAGPGLSTITSTALQNVPINNHIVDKTLGMYVQEVVGWRDKLFVTGAVRIDNNSAFGNDIKLVTYPKASLSWVVAEADDPLTSWLSSLRVRAAWGQSGEQPEAFSALRTWSPVTGPNNSAGVTPNTVGNPNLTAEVGEETELGFDAGLLDNRVDFQFTAYNKLTKDAILERDLPPSLGFTGQQFVNAGRILNQGLEAQLNARLLDGEGLTWDFGVNFSYNRAEIQQLSGEAGDTTIVFNSWSSMEHRVGHAPYSWFGVDVVSADLDPTTFRAVNAMCSDGQGGTTPCFDARGNTIAPRVNLGRAIAPYEWSVNSGVNLGNGMRFHALVTSEMGHKRFDNTNRQRCRLLNLCRENAYPEERDPVRQATIQSNDQIIDAWVNDVGFIRLKELSFTYDLPERFLRGFGMSRAVWQIAGRNLLTFTDWTASDPEVLFSSGGRAFMQQNNYPQPQQIVTSIRFTF